MTSSSRSSPAYVYPIDSYSRRAAAFSSCTRRRTVCAPRRSASAWRWHIMERPNPWPRALDRTAIPSDGTSNLRPSRVGRRRQRLGRRPRESHRGRDPLPGDPGRLLGGERVGPEVGLINLGEEIGYRLGICGSDDAKHGVGLPRNAGHARGRAASCRPGTAMETGSICRCGHGILLKGRPVPIAPTSAHPG